LTLPFIFWNVDWLMAHHLLYVVNIGLYTGNVMKDVFCLPRPSGVWRASALAETDSSGLLDYGFPSTHTMNGLSNSGFMLAFYFWNPLWGESYHTGAPPCPLWLAVFLMLGWTCSLSISRLYMGVHSPTDLRGGFVLGLILIPLWYSLGGAVDSASQSISLMALALLLLLFGFSMLLLCPQTRPPTPTFLQNAVNMGLILGNCLGAHIHSTMEPRALHATLVDLQLAQMPGISVLRYVVGLVLVVGARSVAKVVLGMIVKAMGMRIEPKVGEDQLSLRGLDLAGLAAQKTLVYTVLATGVTAGAPILFLMTGLYGTHVP